MRGFSHESTYNESKEWYTPRYIFDALGVEFDLDPCSPGAHVVPWIPAKRHLTFLDDGLNAHWEGRVYMNPPYGQDTPKWLEHLSHPDRCHSGIALVFARCDTGWFHKYVPLADAVCFIKGRVQFVPAKNGEEDYPALYAKGEYQPKGGCGAGSMLIAYGEDMAKALFRSNLGLALPVSKSCLETFRAARDFAGGGRRPHENPPQTIESGQGSLFTRGT